MKLKHHIYGIVFLYLCGFGLQSQVRCQEERSFMTSCGNSSTLQNAYRYGSQCSSVFRAWYRSNFPDTYWFNSGNSIMEYQNTSSSWSSICRWGRLVGTCYEGLLPQCEAGIGVELLTESRFYAFTSRVITDCESDNYYQSSSLDAFYRRTCDGTEVNQDIKQRIDDVNFDTNTTCLNATHRVEINQCLRSLKDELRNTYNLGVEYQRSAALRRSINRLAGASINCIFSEINRSPCNQATKSVLYHVAKLQLPSFIDDSELELDETTTGDFSSIIRCTVGVYGDPHLKLCEETGLITCSAVGPQLYISNDWFTVTGSNVATGIQRQTNPPITMMRSVQITFHAFDSLDTIATYTALNGNLPTVFDNTNATLQGQGNHEVVLTAHYSGRQRRFIQASTGMVLTLRQWSGNYFFTLRVAQSVIKRSQGLLASGCPRGQTINRSNLFSRPVTRQKRATQAECEQACDAVTDEGLKETCPFDCYALQNTELAVNMTMSAEEDTKIVVELDSELISNAVTPKLTTTKPTTAKPTTKAPTTCSSASYTSLSYSVLVATLLCVFYLRV